jgi:hypothetical protein
VILILILLSSGTIRCLAAGSDILSHKRAAKFRCCLPISWAFRQHLPPEPLGLGMIAALRGKGRQIAPGQMAIDSLIHAAKLVGKAIHDGHAFRAVCSILAGLALALVLVIAVEVVSAVVHPVRPV